MLTFFIENLSNIRNLLDYRQYGAWYLHPRKWENRFQSLSDPKSIEIVKARRIPRGDKTANKQDVTTKKVKVTKFKKFKTWDPKVQLKSHLSNSCCLLRTPQHPYISIYIYRSLVRTSSL